MKNILFAVVQLVSLFTFLYAQRDNPCTQAADCTSCLKAGGQCYWCADEDFTDGANARRPRCNSQPVLKSVEKCKKIVIEDGSVEVKVKDDQPFDSIVQVRPQKVMMKLRKDQTQTFKIKVRPAKDFPVQLYYLMDMSRSMDDDLENLKTLGTKIAKEINTITKNFSLGFGTFVDKTVSPFVQIEKLNRPCDDAKGNPCMPTFGYKHNFDFNKDANKFEEAVSAQKISGNLDTPEGGFDALMQVAVCSSQLGWADIEKSRRIVVFVTDASPHIAGDGKIGGILVPNDGLCHLKNENIDKIYTESNKQDYPSVSLLKEKLKENKIVPIFAVTTDAYGVYEKLTNEWTDLLAAIGVLERDSKNVVDLIRDKYQAISTTARLNTDKLPDGVIVNFKVQPGCPKSDTINECTNMKVGEVVEFEVGVTALTCPEDWKTKDRTFKITIPVFGDVDVTMKMICDCNCETNTTAIEEKSSKCNGTGAYKCGICYCDEGRFGQKCQCDSKDQADQSLCKRNDTESEGLVCSGFGTCICGKCECDRREKKDEIIEGRYCECNNFGCPRFQGEICGGRERGVCECGRCICKSTFLGENCGEVNCTIGRLNCLSDLKNKDLVCSGKGKCACDRCECSTGYKGQYCENCVSCPGKCSDSKDCVLCLAFGEPDKDFCDKLKCDHISWKWVNDTKEQCAFKDDKECYAVFSFLQDTITGNETILVKDEKRCVVVVKSEVNIIAIVLGTIGGIVLLGLILLLLWKLLITAYDNYEYHKFEKDRMKSNWQTGENPIYKPSNQKFNNPTFAGNK